jgi:hypothetical protein
MSRSGQNAELELSSVATIRDDALRPVAAAGRRSPSVARGSGGSVGRVNGIPVCSQFVLRATEPWTQDLTQNSRAAARQKRLCGGRSRQPLVRICPRPSHSAMPVITRARGGGDGRAPVPPILRPPKVVSAASRPTRSRPKGLCTTLGSDPARAGSGLREEFVAAGKADSSTD